MTHVVHVQKVKGISGSEAHLLTLLPALRARGWDVRMIVLHENEPEAADFAARLGATGVPVEMWRMRLDFDPIVVAKLLRLKPTILHTHLVHGDLLSLPAGAVRRVPVRVSTKHGFNEFRSNRILAAADRAAGHFAHRQIAISAGLARYLEQTEGFAAGSFTVVHYGIAAGPEPPPPPVAPRLAAVGRLIPIKGLDVLLDAFGQARARVRGLTLEIAGAGPLEAELRRVAPEGVTFLGRTDGAAGVYERNAVVVVPSRGEGFGMVALEAAERGRAAIVSDVGGLPEIVADGETGLVVPSGDVDALTAALVALSEDPERARLLGAAARDRALREFSIDAATDGVEAVYRQLLEERSA
jgi:glycosyltransferase involved in cell wall biosynthesis